MVTGVNLGCMSVAVSEAGGIHRVRMARRGRCSFEMWPRQRLAEDPCEKVLPVPEPGELPRQDTGAEPWLSAWQQ